MGMTSAEVISVLAGGWSCRNVDLSRIPGFVLAVNDAAIRAPRVDAACSMDRLWTENRWPLLHALAKPTYLRRSAVQNIADRPDWLNVFDCDHTSCTPTFALGVLNGTNSGTCALNLALQCRPRVIYLFGFDMNVSPVDGASYWYPRYAWQKGRPKSNKTYLDWSREFHPIHSAAVEAGIEIINASPSSSIPNFRKVAPSSVLSPMRA